MTVAEVERTFHLPAANVRQWIHRGKVRRLPCGSVDLESLVMWIDRGRDMTEHWRIDSAA